MDFDVLEGDKIEGSGSLWDVPYKEGLVHQVLVASMAKKRQGSKKQKTRSEVRGGGKKPWRQKGTGRARAGTSRGPIWRGGGVTFAAVPKNHEQKVNKKMYRGAVRSILAELNRQGRVVVVKDLTIDKPKTKLVFDKLKSIDSTNVLFLDVNIDSNYELAIRNIPCSDLCDIRFINPVSLINHEKVVFTIDAMKEIEVLLG